MAKGKRGSALDRHQPDRQLPTDMTAKLYTTTCIAETSSAQVKYADAITLVEN